MIKNLANCTTIFLETWIHDKIVSPNSKTINSGNLKYSNHQVLYRLLIMGFKDLSDLWKFPESTPTTVFLNTINI